MVDPFSGNREPAAGPLYRALTIEAGVVGGGSGSVGARPSTLGPGPHRLAAQVTALSRP